MEMKAYWKQNIVKQRTCFDQFDQKSGCLLQ